MLKYCFGLKVELHFARPPSAIVSCLKEIVAVEGTADGKKFSFAFLRYLNDGESRLLFTLNQKMNSRSCA